MSTKKKMSLIVLMLLITTVNLYSQSVNDYRSIGSGDWTDASNWQVFNGVSWVAATNYPGEVAGTNDVSIEGGFTIVLDATIPNSFNSLTVGDGTGGLDTLEIDDTSSLDTLLVTIDDGGFAEWTSNVTLFLPTGAAVVIIPSGALDTSKPCSASKRIQIGSVIYSTCNGGAGALGSFEDLNTGGGSLSVSPSSNSPICVGNTLTLFSNASGIDSGTATFSWSATGPGGYTFSSTLEDPTATSLVAGAYTYTVTVTSGSITNSNSVDVTVETPPSAPTSGGNESICTTDTIPALTVSVGAGETADWYSAATSGTLLLSGNTSFLPLAAGSYFAETRNTTSSCVSSSRTEVILTIISCASTTVITNRRITYRVGN